MEEIWKDVPGYELYQVSNFGRVRSNSFKKNGQLLNLAYDSRGYPHVKLYNNGSKKTFKVHQLVARVFIPNILNKEQVNHIDGIKTNNNVNNLEWNTDIENRKHAYKTGLIKMKLNPSRVFVIKKLLNVGYKQQRIADIYNVSNSSISMIKTGKRYGFICIG